MIKEKLNEIAGVLYKGNTAKGISMISEVLGELQEAAVSMKEDDREDFLNNALAPALEAMETRDGTLLADIITYEIMERVDA